MIKHYLACELCLTVDAVTLIEGNLCNCCSYCLNGPAPLGTPEECQ